MAEVLITYKAEADSLEAVVKEAVKGNVAIAESATKAGQVASKAYKEVGSSAKAAFGSQEVKKSLDSQVAGIDKLKAGIQQLYKEQLNIIKESGKQSAAYKKNLEDAAALRAQIDKLNATQNGYSVSTGKAEKSQKTLGSALRALKNELTQLEIQGKSDTRQFEALSIAASKLQNKIGETAERIKTLSSSTFAFDAAIGAVKGLAAGFAVAQGAIGLFAKDNEELQEAIAKTNSAIAILTGLQEIAAIITGQGAEKVGVLTAAQSIYNFVIGKSTGLTKAFRIAMLATGVGALVAGIALLVSYFSDLNDEQEAATKSLENYQKVAMETDKVLKDLGNEIIDQKDKIAVLRGEMSKEGALMQKVIRETYTKEKEELLKVNGQTQKLRQEKARLSKETNLSATEQIANGIAITVINEKIAESVRREAEIKSKFNETRKNSIDLIILESRENTKGSEKNSKAIKEVVKAYEELKLIVVDVTDKLAKSFTAGSEATADAELAVRKKVLIETEALQEKGLASFQDVSNAKVSVLLAEARIARANVENQGKDALKVVIKGSADEVAVRNNTVKQLELIDAQLQANIDAANKETQDKIKKGIEDTTKKRKEENKKQIDLVLEYAQAIAGALNSINDLQKQLSENRIAEINLEKETQLKAINESFDTERSKIRQRAALELRTNRAIAAEKTKQAKADKALALFNAIIGTAAAVATAKTLPLKIIAGIIGAAQIALIASRPIPKFAQGGVVGGQLHSQGGTHIEAEKDEYIVKRTQSVKHRKELDAINTSTHAFRNMINERYVRPAIMNYVLNRKQDQGVTVNASLNSKSMEAELKGLRKDIRNSRTRSINNQLDSRYSWQ